MKRHSALNLLLADDDSDDTYFFSKTLIELPISTLLVTVNNGKELMAYLKNTAKLPDILFLDLNMPFKNGAECLAEIRSDKSLVLMPVIIYSTSIYADVAEQLYSMGAHYYVRKSGLDELSKTLNLILNMIIDNKLTRPPVDHFILSNARVH